MASVEEKKAVARQLVSAKYSIANPDLNIRSTLDEPVEQIATADFYNGPAAHWVQLKTPFTWLHLDHEDLDAVQTVRDFGKICFAHLADKPTAEIANEEVFGG